MAPFRPYMRGTALNKTTKDKRMDEMMQKKEKSIQRFADAKSASIAISSAFNGATDIAVAMMKGRDMSLEEFWQLHHDIYEQYLSGFSQAQVDGVAIYQEAAAAAGMAREEKKDWGDSKSKDVGRQDAEFDL